AAIDDLDLETKNREEVRNIIGLGLTEAMQVLFPEGDSALVKALSERYRDHFLSHTTTPSEMFPGAVTAIKNLADMGYLLAVATGKGRNGLNRVLTETGLGEYFHATRTADETFSKPHPQMLLELMDVLGAAPEQTLMVGDTEYDMLLAKNANASSLAVSYGVHETERLLKCQPMGCIDTISDLEPWLNYVA
ncbi:MAG: HAD-IA family hydrolase, partial [Gammaproteobacteria bacterium]|nr:HAD-IA family hydrolase [Gammaproteobacteria bacterium]